MKKDNFSHQTNDKEIEMMSKYVPEYTSYHARNIKNKFEQKAKIKQRKLPFKKLVLVGLAASMVFTATLVYAGVIDISNIYTAVFGENAQLVEPYIQPLDSGDSRKTVSTQCEYDGIVIKLISAINDENSLRIFATVTDTKGDRLGENMNFTSWGLSQGYGGNVSVVDYNPDTQTATLMITSLGNDHKGSAILSVNGFSTGLEVVEDLPEDHLNIARLLKEHTPILISHDEVWQPGGGFNSNPYSESRLLQADEMDIKLHNRDMFSLSNIGFVDGLLHIQMKAALRNHTLTDGSYINVNLVNSEKEIIYEPTVAINFLTDGKYAYQKYALEPHDEHTELIYKGVTTPEQLNNLSLTIDYMKSPNIIEGNWEFSFMIPERVTTEFLINKDIPINGLDLKIDSISLSPIGITIHLPQIISDNYSHSDIVYVEYKDGTIIELAESSIHTYEDESTLIFGGQVIEIEKIKSAIINGKTIIISQ